MIELNKILNITNMFIYYDNKNRQLITPAIRNELLIKIQAEFEMTDYIKYVISAYMDNEKTQYNELLKQYEDCKYTGEFIKRERMKEELTKSIGAYESLHKIYDDYSKKLEKYYKWIYLLKHEC